MEGMGIGGERSGEKVNWSVGARGIRLHTRFWLAAGSLLRSWRELLLHAVATAFVLFGGKDRPASCSAYGIAVTTVKVSLTSFRLTSKPSKIRETIIRRLIIIVYVSCGEGKGFFYRDSCSK